MKKARQLLEVILKVSEKAANIARACRRDKALFSLLVQEKNAEEKNPRFLQDFKTLADVLIQETIRHDIGIEFPELVTAVQGEENNVFSNILGQTITVEVCQTLEETAELLTKVLDGNEEAAELLSFEVHKEIDLSDITVDHVDIPSDLEIDVANLGIWIDPIDSTADYINGVETIDEDTGLHLSGLRCVTVLIGAYFKDSGLPVLGVVNRPFYNQIDSEWRGLCYWGWNENDKFYCSIDLSGKSASDIVLISRSEDADVKTKLRDSKFKIVEAAGAGYKIINVALGLADAYILSRGSTYRWDVCGPHSIIRALNGDVLDYTKFLKDPDGCDATIKYSSLSSETCNKGGVIAVRNKDTLNCLKSILC